MAKNPFQQLRVIRNASHKGKLVYDCYRLLYQPKLLNKSYTRLMKSTMSIRPSANTLQGDNINLLICLLRKEKFRFNNGSNHFVDKWMYLTLEMLLREILLPRFGKNAFPQITKQGILLLKNNLLQSTWCLQLNLTEAMTKNQSKILLEECSVFIKDRRFLLLLHNYFKSIHPSKVDNLGRLIFSFFLTIFDKEIRKFDSRIFFLRFHNRILIFHQNKQYLNKMLSHLKLILDNILKFRTDLIESYLFSVKEGIQIGDVVLKWKNQSVKITISEQAMSHYAKKYHYGNLKNFIPVHRTYLVNKPEKEILAVYVHELKRIQAATSYVESKNAYKKLYYLAKQSYIKTLAFKKRKSKTEIYLYLEENPQLTFTNLNLW